MGQLASKLKGGSVTITLEISDDEINRISGELAGAFTLEDFKSDPRWFIKNADSIEVRGRFGKYSEERQ